MRHFLPGRGSLEGNLRLETKRGTDGENEKSAYKNKDSGQIASPFKGGGQVPNPPCQGRRDDRTDKID